MQKVKRSKNLDTSLTLVTNKNQITKLYYHLGNDQVYYIHQLDEYSIKDIDKFIRQKLIFVKSNIIDIK